MKRALRILLALVVATTILGGAFTGSAAAQDIDLSDDDVLDVSANVLNPSTAAAANIGNVGSGDQTAQAESTSVSNSGNFVDA